MIKMKDIKELNFKITWKLLYRGILNNQLTTEDIVEYAMKQLEKGDDRMEICELSGLRDSEIDDILDILNDLANEENSQSEIEERKLRAAIVRNALNVKHDNCIDGLMELTELWVGLGYPKDYPHIFQGKDNNITPLDYYTDENYNYLYEKNRRWLEKEINFLVAHQE